MAEAGADVIGVDWRVPLAEAARRAPGARGPAGQPRPGRVPGPLGGAGGGGPAHSSGAAVGAAGTSSTSATVCSRRPIPTPWPAGRTWSTRRVSDRVRVAVDRAAGSPAWPPPGNCGARLSVTVFEPDRLGGRILTTDVRRASRRRGAGRLHHPRPRCAPAVPGGRRRSGAGRAGCRTGRVVVRAASSAPSRRAWFSACPASSAAFSAVGILSPRVWRAPAWTWCCPAAVPQRR